MIALLDPLKNHVSISFRKGWLGIFLEINKRGDPNKRGGWKNFQNLVKGVVPIKVSQVEKFPKINKRVTPYIRQVRVSTRPLHAQKRYYTLTYAQ